MDKNIIKLITKAIESRNYKGSKLDEWSKKESNSRLTRLLELLFSPSTSHQEQKPCELDEIKKELSIKIAIRESREKIYKRKTIRGIFIGAISAAVASVILIITINKTYNNQDEFTHNIAVMYNNQSATILSDGTKVILRPGSNLMYDEFEDSDQRVVKLNGEAYFDVAKSKKEFIVIAGGSKIKVLGTKFNVKANEYDDFVETILLSGSVEFQYEDSIMETKSIVMNPSEQLTYDKATKQYSLSPNRKPREYIINDEYKFDNVPLSKVFEVISDIYELDVIVDNEEIEQTRYTGVIRRSHSITNTMKILSEVASIQYHIDSKSIIIRHK